MPGIIHFKSKEAYRKWNAFINIHHLRIDRKPYQIEIHGKNIRRKLK